MAAFGLFVMHVVAIVTQKQMVGIDATRAVTMMENLQASGDRTTKLRPSDPMRPFRSPIAAIDLSVAFGVSRAGP